MFLPEKIRSGLKGAPSISSALEKAFLLARASGEPIGTITFLSPVKIQIDATQTNLEKSYIIISGNLKETQFMLVKKWLNSREQKLFGKSQGRVMAKKNLLDAHWISDLEIDEDEVSPLVLSAIALLVIMQY